MQVTLSEGPLILGKSPEALGPHVSGCLMKKNKNKTVNLIPPSLTA